MRGNGAAVDRDWHLILFNNEAARHFRCAPEDVLGQSLWDVFPRTRDTGLGQLFVKVMASRDTIRSEAESVVFRGRWMAYRLFALGDLKAKGRLIDTGGFAKKDRITHRIEITSLKDIDDEVKHWLKVAYDRDASTTSR